MGDLIMRQVTDISNIAAIIIFLLIVLIGGWLGEQDYRDQRADECFLQDKDYNEQVDMCVKRTK